jgi:hypothetical protein
MGPAANGTDSGAAYVVFGTSSPATVNLSNSDPPTGGGFLIKGAAAGDQAGFSVRGAGDVNGDGRPDVIVGSPFADANGTDSGAAYVLYGFGQASLSYGPLVGVRGQPLGPLSPTFRVGAGHATFVVSPPLPAGLALDPATGVVSGTPSVSETSTHTVSLSDLTGTISAALSVSIRPPGLPAFGARTLVTLKLARKQVPARGPLVVLVSNENGFEVTGTLSGQTTAKVSVSRKRRVKLKAKAFRVAAHAKTTVKLKLPKPLSRLLKRKHRLSLRLTAKLKDPAGNLRTFTKTVKPRLKRRR